MHVISAVNEGGARIRVVVYSAVLPPENYYGKDADQASKKGDLSKSKNGESSSSVA